MYALGMTSPTPLRVIGYVRVSTNKQDIGPEVQIADLQRAALARGWDLEIRRENAASAKSMDKRPVLKGALEDLAVKRGCKYDALAVSKLDRLTRSVRDGAGILADANSQGWALICLDLGVDTSTTSGKGMAHVNMAFAEMERERISQRTRDNMQEIKRTTGKHMGRSAALPIETMKYVHELRGGRLSMQKIADRLETEGVKTATGGRWYPSTVKRVLDSVTLAKALES